MLKDCLDSLVATADYPYELIVNEDTDSSGVSEILFDYYKRGIISKLVMTGGNNRGVGRSFANCVGMVEGQYVFKIDTDLVFKDRWLSESVRVLENHPEVGVVSPFNYRSWDPSDTRFNILEEKEDCRIVDDLVSSVYGFRRGYLEISGWQEDDGFHQKLCENYQLKMALTKEDLVTNQGFGVHRSTYVSGTEEAPFKTPTHNEPLIFKKGQI